MGAGGSEMNWLAKFLQDHITHLRYLSREQQLDRYFDHADHCRTCQEKGTSACETARALRVGLWDGARYPGEETKLS